MTNSDLSKYISNRFNDVVISGHSIAVKLRREVVGATPQQIRTAIESLSRLNPGHFRGSLEYDEIAGVQCGVITYKEIKGPIVIWIHGGGFTFGSAMVYKATAIYLARYYGCQVIIPNYRLSPEYKYPIPFQDCLNVYEKLVEDGEKIDLIGDSAGGNIASALVQTCISTNIQVPEKLVLLSPWLDLSKKSVSNKNNNSDYSPFDNLDTLAFSRDYIGEINDENPNVSPLRGSFKGFPKTHVQASKNEFLFDDARLCLEKLKKEGVGCSNHYEEKASHGWHLVPDFLPEASRSMDKVIEFLKR